MTLQNAMRRCIGTPVLGIITILLVGCYGDHPNSHITCWQGQFGGRHGGINSIIWHCAATWVDSENQQIHHHRVPSDYLPEYLGCKERNKKLIADIMSEVIQTRRGLRTRLDITNLRCVDHD